MSVARAVRASIRVAVISMVRPRLQPVYAAAPRCLFCTQFHTSCIASKKKSGKQREVQESNDDTEPVELLDMDNLRSQANELIVQGEQMIKGMRHTAKARAEALEKLTVDLGNKQGGSYVLSALASVTGVDGRRIQLSCFDPDYVKPVIKAIVKAFDGLNPQPAPGNANGLIIPLPTPTRESRAALAAEVSKQGEALRTRLRAQRQAAQKTLAGKGKKTSKDLLAALRDDVDGVYADAGKRIDKLINDTKRAVME